MFSNQYLFSVLLFYVLSMTGLLTLRGLQCPINKLKNAACLRHHFIYLHLLHAVVIQKDTRMGTLVLPLLFSYLEPLPALDFTRCTLDAPLLLLSLF